jgi:tetratricopeptide (TPR) repeat protein
LLPRVIRPSPLVRMEPVATPSALRPRARAWALAGGLLVVVAGVAILSPRAQGAEPFTPGNAAEVLERLPYRLRDPEAANLRAMRAGVLSRPNDVEARVALARELIGLYRQRSDPRYLGRAQAALGAEFEQATPARGVRLLRAVILQSNHEFARALADFDVLVRETPQEPQPWLSRASVRTVVGSFADAESDCERTRELSGALVAEACLAGPRSMTGKSQLARERLLAVWQGQRNPDATEGLWVLSLLGELEAQLGLNEDAVAHFEQALALVPEDAYTLGAYADLLLEQGRGARVLELLRPFVHVDALLLRAAIAAKATRSEDAEALLREVSQRFDAARERGDSVHRREEARAALELDGAAGRALELARENWAMQRERWDARLVLEAALAAKEPAEARPVVEFLRRIGNTDAKLSALVRRVEGS